MVGVSIRDLACISPPSESTETRTDLPHGRSSLSASASRAANAGSLSSRDKRMFQGQQDWEECRQNYFAIQLSTGRRTLSQAKA
jgi:hypothetical protein